MVIHWSRQTTAEAEAKAADVRAKHASKQLAEAKKRLGGKQAEATKLDKELTAAQKTVDACTKCVETVSAVLSPCVCFSMHRRLQELGFDAEAAAALEASLAEEQAALVTLKEQAAELQGQLSALRFDYRDPESGFDRTRVKARLKTSTELLNDLRCRMIIDVVYCSLLHV